MASETLLNPEDEPLLTADDVGTWIVAGRSTVYRLAETGELAAVRIGRSLRFEKAVVRAFIASRRTKKPALQVINRKVAG